MFCSLFIPQFSLQAMLRHEPDLCGRAVALVDPTLVKPSVTELTAAARERGVVEGLTASQAMARCADLIIKTRSVPQEQIATEVLLQTAAAFSPNLEDTAPGVCIVELKGLGLSFAETIPGTPAEPWARRILRALAQCGLTGQIGFGVTPELAAFAARAANPVLVLQANCLQPPSAFPLSHRMGEGRGEGNLTGITESRVPGVTRHIACASIDSFPVSALQPTPELLGILDRWGIRTIGDLLALGKDRVVERLGVPALELFDRVSPHALRPLKLAVPKEEFVETMDFEQRVETVEPLLFVLRRFVEQLARRLDLRHLVVGEFHLRLALDSGGAHERSLKIPSPTGHVDTLFRMLHTHLETVRTDSPIVSVRLAAQPARAETHQFGLFETTLRDPNRFAETLARLTALCGPDRVGAPRREPSHRPDAFRIELPEFGVTVKLERTANKVSAGLALRRFRPPVSAHIEFRGPRPALLRSSISNGAIIDVRGPFLGSGHWWDDTRWAREEWDIRTADGSLLRIFRSSNGCFVEGVYD
jgi:protein ImuB